MRQIVPILLVSLACAAAPGQAAAFELFGVHLFGERKVVDLPPDAISYTTEVTVTGEDVGGLKSALRNASRLVSESKEPSPSPGALLSRARSDYQRLLGVMYGEGRYGPVISITVDGQEASDMAIDAAIPDGAKVDIVVDPGPQFGFGNIDVVNPPAPVTDDGTIPETPAELGLVTGAPARATVILASEASLVASWREHSYAKARIAERTATARHESDALDVYVNVDPGRPAVFGETTVEGTEEMDPGFVAYYAGITPGEPFDPDDLQRARDQLRRLETFSAVRVLEADEIRDDGTLPITLQVSDRKRRVYGGGLKYSTIDGFGAEAYWRHRNLFGRAEKLQLEARVGGIDADDPNEYNYRVAATFIKPGLFTPYTDWVSTVYGEQLAPDTFRARTLGARTGLKHRFNRRLSGELFAQVEASTIDQTTVGNGDFLMASLPGAINYDGSNNEFNPSRGFRIGVRAEPFYEASYNNIGLISETEASVYYGLGNDRLILAARAAVGSIVGAPQDQIPANRLFFAGGGGSIRGYPYRGVGPINKNGEVVGGRSYFVASLEARVQVTESVGVVPFLDMGNAFRAEYPSFNQPLRYAAGLGLRYNTGLGPLRFDVAVPLDPLDGDPNVAFYIGLGQAF
ncbi:autotransporter assembly complex family protein [Acuticoccus sp. MNP-M23]|uniref:autotransporter assembly complex protein TamA n=1 Tax=Acuticoccus sp. MNP-M23 TaxID=3072793 RepID=UPI002816970A|nr:autotransporter assembly complex family protein [Acuticoccus sp. MNP-M23]WMS44727.1 autotransporter assembly complex family protein [Acuticoccus sp. MNP-M23]